MIRGDRSGNAIEISRGFNERGIFPEYFLNGRLCFGVSGTLGDTKIFGDSEFFIFLPEWIHHAGVKGTDFLRGISGYEDAVIFKHDDLRNTVELGFVGIDTIFQYHAKSVPGIDVLDPKGIREESFAHGLAILRTGHPIHEQCMRVNHKLSFKNVVQWRFHGWATGIVENGFAHKVFNQFLTGMRFFGRFHIIKPVDLGSV